LIIGIEDALIETCLSFILYKQIKGFITEDIFGIEKFMHDLQHLLLIVEVVRDESHQGLLSSQ
jgi:hypothetical protein